MLWKFFGSLYVQILLMFLLISILGECRIITGSLNHMLNVHLYTKSIDVCFYCIVLCLVAFWQLLNNRYDDDDDEMCTRPPLSHV